MAVQQAPSGVGRWMLRLIPDHASLRTYGSRRPEVFENLSGERQSSGCRRHSFDQKLERIVFRRAFLGYR